MKYPYITMIHKHNEQIIMEICNEKNNYRVIIKKNNLFDELTISSQKYSQTEKQIIMSIFDLHKSNYIEFSTNLELIKILNT